MFSKFFSYLLVLSSLGMALVSGSAHAYLAGSFGTEQLDPNKETHIYVIGIGHELGSQFLETAISTARRLQESYPDRQYFFLQQRETNDQDEIRLLKRYGVRVIASPDKKLTGSLVVELVSKFNKIASLEFFSHGHSVYGVSFGGQELELDFYQDTPGLEKLKGKFTKFGYVNIHGCNAGFFAAPAISKILERPVLGNLTGSNFQAPFADSLWYFQDDGYFPKDGKFSKTNSSSYAGAKECRNGYCGRLVAIDQPYDGVYGSHNVGLGFKKLFCNYKYGSECFSALAVSLLSFPSERPISPKTSKAEFMLVAKDLLCPIDSTRVKRNDCLKEIDDHYKQKNMELSFFKGPEPICDLSGCKVKAKCDHDKKCVINSSTKENSETNLMTEYINYRKAWDAFHSNK